MRVEHNISMPRIPSPQPCVHCEEDFVPTSPTKVFCPRCPLEVRHPEKVKARSLFASAIRTGAIKRPKKCVQRGCKRDAEEAHHPDYFKPLDVEWLCDWHHYERHRDGERPDWARRRHAIRLKRREQILSALIDNYSL
jgi:hypothetical protein